MLPSLVSRSVTRRSRATINSCSSNSTNGYNLGNIDSKPSDISSQIKVEELQTFRLSSASKPKRPVFPSQPITQRRTMITRPTSNLPKIPVCFRVTSASSAHNSAVLWVRRRLFVPTPPATPSFVLFRPPHRFTAIVELLSRDFHISIVDSVDLVFSFCLRFFLAVSLCLPLPLAPG
jgi:hypothetical protein